MRRFPTLLAAVAAALFALAPAVGDARVGGGRSMGSSGSRTYSAPPPTQTAPAPVRPMERSMTEPSRVTGAPARPGAPAAAPATGGFFSRSPFMAGLMGGLIGAGLGGLLFGGGLFGGMHGFAGFLGLLLQIALIAGLVWLGLRLVRAMRGQPAPAGGVPPHGLARTGYGPAMGAAGGMAGTGAAPRGGEPLPLEKADFDAFERLLIEANEAWSRQDLAALRRIATPEMVQYFADDLAELASRGLRNETRDMRLEQGDLADAWRENGRDYARVAMRFSMRDATFRLSDGAVVEGDTQRRTEATEVWTFVRARGGQWLISAIQQTVPA